MSNISSPYQHVNKTPGKIKYKTIYNSLPDNRLKISQNCYYKRRKNKSQMGYKKTGTVYTVPLLLIIINVTAYFAGAALATSAVFLAFSCA